MNSNIVWLASYPKSGNTWFRCFLTALQSENFSLDELVTSGIFSSKSIINRNLDIDVDEVPLEKIDEYRRIALRYFNSTLTEPTFIKVHDACIPSAYDKQRNIPQDITLATIYLVRDPRDVAISYANHNGSSIADSVYKSICNEKGAMVKKNRGQGQLYQPLLTWQQHYFSWKNQVDLNVHVVRYEDMLHHPLATFTAAVQHIGLPYLEKEIAKAIEITAFDRLKEKEEKEDFREKPSSERPFFYKGKTGNWKTMLKKEEIEAIERVNYEAMKELGYL